MRTRRKKSYGETIIKCRILKFGPSRTIDFFRNAFSYAAFFRMCTREECRLQLDLPYLKAISQYANPYNTTQKHITEPDPDSSIIMDTEIRIAMQYYIKKRRERLHCCNSCKLFTCGFCTTTCMNCDARICNACSGTCYKYLDFSDDESGCNGMEFCVDCIRTQCKLFFDEDQCLSWMCSTCALATPSLVELLPYEP